MKNLLYGLRYLLKSKGNNITRIVSLTIGMAVGLLIFSYVTFSLSFDRFIPDRDRVHQLWARYSHWGETREGAQMLAPLGPIMQQEIPQVEYAARICEEGMEQFLYGETYFDAELIEADTTFFDVLDYGILRGDPRSILASPEQIMVSEEFANKIFGSKDPLGEILFLDGKTPLTVSGTFRTPPANSSLRFDIIRSWEAVSYPQTWEGWDMYPTYIKLYPGANIGDVERQLSIISEKYGLDKRMSEWQMELFLQPITKSHTTGSEVFYISMLLLGIGFLAIFIACMNYVLISISMLAGRGKTMAMLKCNGARQADVFMVSLWETVFILLLSLILAIFLIWGLSSPIERLIDVKVTDLFAPERIWAPLLVIAVIFAMAGLVPAYIFGKVPVNIAFRGTLSNRRGWKRSLLFVQILCVTFVATFLFITTRQFNHITQGDFGYDKENLIIIDGLRATNSSFAGYKDELLSMPEVKSAALSPYLPIWGFGGMPAHDEKTGEMLFSCRYGVADDTFLETLGIPLLEGRGFRPDEAVGNVIVNRRYAEMRGWTDSPVGKYISNSNNPQDPHQTVIGVVEDFWTEDKGNIDPLVLHPLTGWNSERTTFTTTKIYVKTYETSRDVITSIENKVKAFAGNSYFTVTPYDTLLGDILRSDKQFRNTILVVSLVTLFISLTGLIGYLSDEMRRRRKEIAVRKVNGARRRDVIMLIIRDVAIITLPGVLIGCASAYFLGRSWLRSFPQKTPLSLWIFLLAAVAVVAVVALTELFRTWKVAGTNPVDMLKNE